LTEIKDNFREKTPIKFGIFLKLNFGKVNGIVRMALIGQKDTIHAKREFFNFYGFKLVILGNFRISSH